MVNMRVLYDCGQADISVMPHITISQLYERLQKQFDIASNAKFMVVTHPAKDYYINGRHYLLAYNLAVDGHDTVKWIPLKAGTRIEFFTDIRGIRHYQRTLLSFVEQEMAALSSRIARLAIDIASNALDNAPGEPLDIEKLSDMQEKIGLYLDADSDALAIPHIFDAVIEGRRNWV